MQRLSLGRIYANAQQNIARNYAQLFAAQTQLATGKRINRPSDDLAGTRRILTLAGEREGIDRNLSNIGSARSHVQSGASNLVEVSDLVARIREKAVQGANGSLSQTDRASIAAEVDALLANVVAVLNTKVEDRYLFAGTETTTHPFDLVTGADGLTRIDYSGNSGVQEVDIAPELRMALNVPGSVFLSAGTRGATTFTGTTGAASGAGADSGLGRDLLQVAHTLTRYGAPPMSQDPATGLRPGSSSTTGDTILGSSAAISVTTDALGNGTITLNGGTAVPFTSADTNLEVTGPNGEVIFVDTSAMIPNLTGASVPVLSDGTLSTDGGLTTVGIDFGSTSQQVVDSETGTVLHVDSTGIAATGTEEIGFTGTANLFDTIIGIRDALRDQTKTATDINLLLNGSLDDLDRGLEGITSGITTLGSRANQLDSVESRLGDLGLTLDTLRGEIEDADIAQVVSDLQRYETLYQASLVLATRVNSLSLLNFIS
ncbi:MAG: flagellar hook-associated protein 3 [Planctomycetes bacterium]|nr:flagellar hook-associated protein 3 [Planctomycetota bacterium]